MITFDTIVNECFPSYPLFVRLKDAWLTRDNKGGLFFKATSQFACHTFAVYV